MTKEQLGSLLISSEDAMYRVAKTLLRADEDCAGRDRACGYWAGYKRESMRRKDREVTDVNTIKNILDRCRTASVAMVDNGWPYVIPLSYGYDLAEDCLTLYFHCAKEGRNVEFTEAQAETVCVFKIIARDYTGKQRAKRQ